MIIRALTALTLVSACLPAAAAIYKYVDPQGRVHYADQLKPGWQRVDVQAPSVSDDPGQTGETTETREQAIARAAECARKEEQLKNYRTARRVIERDTLGREREFSEEDRKLLIEKTEQEIEACRQPPSPADTQPY